MADNEEAHIPKVLRDQPNTPRTREVKKLILNASLGFKRGMEHHKNRGTDQLIKSLGNDQKLQRVYLY